MPPSDVPGSLNQACFYKAAPIALGYRRRLLANCRHAIELKMLRTNALIAIFVGLVLSAANQFEQIRAGALTGRLFAKLATNFAVPFIVSTTSAVLNRRHQVDSQPEQSRKNS